jgi:uncharacterized delta-60 repeat protein
MKQLISFSRIAAIAFFYFAFTVRTPVSAATGGAAGSLSPTIAQMPLGGIETDGSLDLAFDAGNFTNGEVDGAALLPDGKLLIAGQFNKIHGVTRHGMARLNVDGTLDASFDSGSVAQYGAKTPIVQSDGKIIILLYGAIARLNDDGSLDASFRIPHVLSIDGLDDGSGNATNPGPAYSAILQPDGKIVVVGRFFFVITGPGTSVARSCVARFNSDGTFDPSYDPGAGANDGSPFDTVVNYAVRQNAGTDNGKIVIAGNFSFFDGHGAPGLVRLKADGSYDNTFTPATAPFPSEVYGLFVQSNDQVIVFGSFVSFNGVDCSSIVRLDNSGGVDSGFATAQFRDYTDFGTIRAVAQQPNGKLMVGGSFHSLGGVVANNVARLETTGATDAGFDAAAAGPSASYVMAILVHPSDGRNFVGGYFSSYGGAVRNNLAWVSSDGSLGNTFNGLGGAVDAFPQIYALATQSDGKIVVGGFFTSLNGASHYNIVRLNPDSTIDPSFDPNLGTYGSVRSIFVQPDGKILIGGNLRAVDGVSRNRVARLNSDGTLDSSFDPGTGADSSVYAVTEDSTGSVYIGGAFFDFNGASRRRVAKLSPTGALDTTFQTGTGTTNGNVYAMAPPDGAGGIVIGGSFGSYNGFPARRIARLNVTTGAVDTAFTPFGSAGFNSEVRTLALTPDGKYCAGGLFGSFNGQPRSHVAKLNGDGTIDGSFVGPSSIGQIVYQVAPQNGKVFVGGYLLSPPPNIARLTSSGPFDPTFEPGTGFGISPADAYVSGPATVTALAIQGDGKLLVGGMFNKYNGINRICLARLTTAPTGPPGTLGNISTRLRVLSGDNALIGGMIATGTAPKRVIIRAIGPTLTGFGVPGALANPTLDLFQGSTLLFSNDDWQNSTQQGEIAASGLAPSNAAESAIIWTLTPGQTYTAAVRGNNSTTGIGVVEAFDLDPAAASKLGNISTRGFVDVDDNVMIAGLIAGPSNGTALKILVRALGPTLSDFGVAGALANPTLDLVNASGTVIRSNNDWKDDPQQRAAIEAAGLGPSHDEEAALVETVAPGAYTAVVRGNNRATGVGLVEAYNIP